MTAGKNSTWTALLLLLVTGVLATAISSDSQDVAETTSPLGKESESLKETLVQKDGLEELIPESKRPMAMALNGKEKGWWGKRAGDEDVIEKRPMGVAYGGGSKNWLGKRHEDDVEKRPMGMVYGSDKNWWGKRDGEELEKRPMGLAYGGGTWGSLLEGRGRYRREVEGDNYDDLDVEKKPMGMTYGGKLWGKRSGWSEDDVHNSEDEDVDVVVKRPMGSAYNGRNMYWWLRKLDKRPMGAAYSGDGQGQTWWGKRSSEPYIVGELEKRPMGNVYSSGGKWWGKRGYDVEKRPMGMVYTGGSKGGRWYGGKRSSPFLEDYGVNKRPMGLGKYWWDKKVEKRPMGDTPTNPGKLRNRWSHWWGKRGGDAVNKRPMGMAYSGKNHWWGKRGEVEKRPMGSAYLSGRGRSWWDKQENKRPMGMAYAAGKDWGVLGKRAYDDEEGENEVLEAEKRPMGYVYGGSNGSGWWGKRGVDGGWTSDVKRPMGYVYNKPMWFV